MVEHKLSKEEFTKEFNRLHEEKTKIVLFGAGEIGARGVLRLEYLGLKDKIVCFGDNNASKIGTAVEGIRVLPKEEILAKYPEAYVIITVGSQQAAKEIHGQLEGFGFRNFIDRQALLHRFEFDGQREKALVCRNGKYILRQIVVCITERCTLKCKNCSQLMPKFAHPQDLDTDQVIESIRNLTDAIDYVQDLTLLGGEPLMNKDLARICQAVGELKKRGKIKFINIVSNATIIPGGALLQVMKEYGIMIMLSDYGKLSVNMEKAQRACEEYGAQWRYAYRGGRNEEKIQYWGAVDTAKQNLTKEQMDAKFKNCNSVYDCNFIYRGHYYLCSYAAFAAGLGMIDPEGNSFDLLNPAVAREERIAGYRAFMEEEKTVDACDYCNMHGRVPAAEQL